jgi:SAM-dependent methyltransferase
MSAALSVEFIDNDISAVEWLRVERCPVCNGAPTSSTPLIDSGYVFGDEKIPFPVGGIHIAACGGCGLHFKTAVPDPESLSEVMERQAGKKWMEPYGYEEEIEQLKRIAADRTVDLLDVGCGNGGLLAAWGRHSHGRRSALDVVQHPGCADHIEGEFIRGLIDGERLQWSGRSYDIVTLFDVLEHLYRPRTAFEHLRELVREGGVVVIETGNVESDWPKRDGPEHWWYARLFEHHIFWSRRPLEHIARQLGFQLLTWSDVKHKGRASMSTMSKVRDVVQMGIYRAAPALYPRIAASLGKYWTQPWSPFTQDHFRVVLRRL